MIEVDKLGTSKGWPARRIDYIFIDQRFFEVINAGLVPSKYRIASDHVAYWAKVILKN